jgi:hypothetical protein
MVTDKEIEDSLWYYYFDVDKTVKYFQRMKDQCDHSNMLIYFREVEPNPRQRKAREENTDALRHGCTGGITTSFAR